MDSGSSGSCRAWSLDTLEEPPSPVVDAGQKTPTPMSVFNDRECRLSVIAHRKILEQLAESCTDHRVRLVIADLQPGVSRQLEQYGTLAKLSEDALYDSVSDVIMAFEAGSAATT
jgi:hypothetical protein